MPHLLESLGQYIRRKRLEAHMTQEQVAERIGVTLGHVSHVERGAKDLDQKHWKALCDAIPGVTERSLANARVSGGGPVSVPPEMLTPRQRTALVERMLSAEPVGAE